MNWILPIIVSNISPNKQRLLPWPFNDTWLLYVRTTRPNIKKKFYFLPTRCMSVICMALGTHSYHLATEQWLTVFCIRDGLCLLRGTNRIFKYNAGEFLCRTEWHWGRFSSEYICFPLSVSFHQCSRLIFMCTVILPEGQTGKKTWETSKTQRSFENRGAWTRRMSATFVSCKGFTADNRFLFVKKI